ncbi:putative MFS transporter [Aspergillus thermomutatus]|uniref:Major facilitator superfamily (MFS) profile domain-containing protein n=1 Tax=Aspergillus thermomutatus TaxID=41047 RepID=A0A397H8B7_ASPTH|nr:uncharacterized protein CDV56_107877 [Aspergillus thermomutatus]RHZ57934.1 hypothetical protein CDV56_107877 [Aspergillus thermomutatus]
MGLLGDNDTPRNDTKDAIEQAPSVDTEKQNAVHQDEDNDTALPAMPAPVITIDPAVERRVLRKLDLRVPTLLGFLYLLSLLDRSNIGNAYIAGMKQDLRLSGHRYSWLLTIFYISYTLFEFLALMWKIIPPHRWAAITVLSWGIVATCQAAAQSWEGMMALRFLLGMAEAAFGPGTPYLLSFFYRRHELGLRCGLFVSAAPLANTFAGALAYGITSGHSKLANWRLLFLVEGAPSLIAAFLAWFFLPDHPASARFLNEEEKKVARARGLRRSGEGERVTGIDWKDIGRTLLDVKAWFTAITKDPTPDEKDAPRYVRGQSICAAFMFFTTILALTLRFLLVWENKRLDRKYGTRNEESAGGGSNRNDDSVAEENYGSGFRYVL